METCLIKLSKPQQVISNDHTRFRIVVAGRRFGKTMLAINELAKYSVKPKQRVLALYSTYGQAKNTIWNDLKEKLYAVNWIKKVNESELTIILKNDSKIFVKSADNREALRGSRYDFIVFDEAADLHKDVWTTICRPMLADSNGHALFIGTPKGKGNWFYDLFVKAGVEQDWNNHAYRTIDGGWITEEEIESARADLDEREFKQEFEAEFQDYSGIIYHAFTEDNIQPNTFPIEQLRTLHIGMDFNNSPMSAVMGYMNGNKLNIVDEIEIYQSNTYEMIQEIKRRYPNKNYVCYPDSSGSFKSTNSNVSDHTILANNGFKLVVGKTNPSVIDRINAVNSLLCNANGERNLLIDPKCKKTRECLIKHTYKPGTRQPHKEGNTDFSHMNDSLGYLVWQNFGIKRDLGKGYAHNKRSL
ncbi:phage terminase large subunit [bacterium]|nr:phage terminase large subunit [bacterium]